MFSFFAISSKGTITPANLSPFGKIHHFEIKISHPHESCRSEEFSFWGGGVGSGQLADRPALIMYFYKNVCEDRKTNKVILDKIKNKSVFKHKTYLSTHVLSDCVVWMRGWGMGGGGRSWHSYIPETARQPQAAGREPADRLLCERLSLLLSQNNWWWPTRWPFNPPLLSQRDLGSLFESFEPWLSAA